MYHPPVELSNIFKPVLEEYGKPESNLIEIIELYSPLSKDVSEIGGIYHVVLTNQLIKILQKELEVKKKNIKNLSELSSDLDFLDEIFSKGAKSESMIIMQFMP